jgi:hypothetical protein
MAKYGRAYGYCPRGREKPGPVKGAPSVLTPDDMAKIRRVPPAYAHGAGPDLVAKIVDDFTAKVSSVDPLIFRDQGSKNPKRVSVERLREQVDKQRERTARRNQRAAERRREERAAQPPKPAPAPKIAATTKPRAEPLSNAERSRLYRVRSGTKAAENARAYYEANPERRRQQWKAYRTRRKALAIELRATTTDSAA